MIQWRSDSCDCVMSYDSVDASGNPVNPKGVTRCRLHTGKPVLDTWTHNRGFARSMTATKAQIIANRQAKQAEKMRIRGL